MSDSLGMLDVVLFGEAEAARLLRVPPTTLHRWLNGDRRKGVDYPPVIRPEATDDRDVTWGEFVEAGLLAQYRRHHQVPLRELRRCVDRLRPEFGRYPLASRRPFVGEGRRLLHEVQRQSGLTPEFWLVTVADDQLLLLPPADSFIERVEFDEHEIAASWRPTLDPSSPVRMQPDVRFGLPAVRGIRTEVLWEHSDAGEDVDEIAAEFDLDRSDVVWALAYEQAGRGVQAA